MKKCFLIRDLNGVHVCGPPVGSLRLLWGGEGAGRRAKLRERGLERITEMDDDLELTATQARMREVLQSLCSMSGRSSPPTSPRSSNTASAIRWAWWSCTGRCWS